MDVRQYLQGLVHVHTRLSNYRGHVESDQTVSSHVATLKGRGLLGPAPAPWQFMAITEHVSNPVSPGPLARLNPRLAVLARRTWLTHVQGVPVWHGFEASILPDGNIDLAAPLNGEAALVIASCHNLPDGLLNDGPARSRLLQLACEHSTVDVLGHPSRGIEALAGMDWPAVFAAAARTGTAIEVNLNNFPESHREPARLAVWRTWLRHLAASNAAVFIGVDLHNQVQLDRLTADWQAVNQPGRPSVIEQCVTELAAAGIGPDRVITADAARFERWLSQPKPSRRLAPA